MCDDGNVLLSPLTTLTVCTRPAVRETLISLSAKIDCNILCAMSVSWPRPESELFYIDGETQDLGINPIFEDWIRDLDNWTLDSSLLTSMPYLASKARFR